MDDQKLWMIISFMSSGLGLKRKSKNNKVKVFKVKFKEGREKLAKVCLNSGYHSTFPNDPNPIFPMQ
jgi:hypothetical protein